MADLSKLETTAEVARRFLIAHAPNDTDLYALEGPLAELIATSRADTVREIVAWLKAEEQYGIGSGPYPLQRAANAIERDFKQEGEGG